MPGALRKKGGGGEMVRNRGRWTYSHEPDLLGILVRWQLLICHPGNFLFPAQTGAKFAISPPHLNPVHINPSEITPPLGVHLGTSFLTRDLQRFVAQCHGELEFQLEYSFRSLSLRHHFFLQKRFTDLHNPGIELSRLPAMESLTDLLR